MRLMRGSMKGGWRIRRIVDDGCIFAVDEKTLIDTSQELSMMIHQGMKVSLLLTKR